MLPTNPRKNSRQWRTIIFLITADPSRWWTDAGEGHLQFLDDMSRLREKGWPIEIKENEDGFSKSHRLDRTAWDSIKDSIPRFW